MHRRLSLVLAACLVVALSGCQPENGPGGPSPKPSPTAKPRPGFPASMAALGDSITAGVGACFALLPCPRVSWATGDRGGVNSHYLRILAANPAIKGNQQNFAEAGSVAADLPAQARLAVQAKVAYVPVLIGANDACTRRIDEMTSAADFRRSVDAALLILKAGLPGARILLVSIPDVYRVWQVAHTNSNARLVWGLGICQALLANPTSTAAADVQRRQQFRDRVDQYDAQLAAACRAYGSRCRYDGGAAHRFVFGLGDLSDLDFFHPNLSGQNQLAAATYPGTFTW
ncbi:MAG TPA: GDSL-type esterase/lipase family protein [Rugosimonospora sp.]|nr:GDSL-type esterase/lipase family protein [Rugosimonospora sp.]